MTAGQVRTLLLTWPLRLPVFGRLSVSSRAGTLVRRPSFLETFVPALRSLPLLLLAGCFSAAPQAVSQASGTAPALRRVDPPNWWANMPRAMLLVQGDHLEGAHFHLGVPAHPDAVHIARTKISANGHWAELWLADTPTKPQDLTLEAENAAGQATLPFSFQPRRAASDGFAGFSASDVLYLIMTDRFADGDLTNDGLQAHDIASSSVAASERSRPRGWHGGDLRGIQDHLDYLQELGITTVWITPVYSNAGEPDSYHGYGATDMYAVDPHFGSLAEFRALAAALHARGMKLVLDTVPNHIGPAHPWVADEPEPDWFHGTKAQHTEAQGDFLPLTDPHAPWRDQHKVTQGWFANRLPDMNQENPAVTQYLIQNAIWWIEQGALDGLRLDTFPYIARPFWAQFHSTLHALYPRLTEVGEVFNGDPIVTSSFAGGVTRTGVDTGLYTPFDYPLHFGIRNVFSGAKPMTELATLLREDSLYPHPERLMPFLDNHDVPRFLSEDGASESAQRLALGFLLTTRGTPQLYTGDELAMAGGADPDNRHDFPGGFPDMGSNAFVPGSRTDKQRQMFDWTRKLLALRAAHPSLCGGEEQVIYASANAIAYVRSRGSERLLIAIHLGQEDVGLHIDMSDTVLRDFRTASPLLGRAQLQVKGTQATLSLGADSFSVLEIQ